MSLKCSVYCCNRLATIKVSRKKRGLGICEEHHDLFFSHGCRYTLEICWRRENSWEVIHGNNCRRLERIGKALPCIVFAVYLLDHTKEQGDEIIWEND